jgi:hypothetical protein
MPLDDSDASWRHPLSREACEGHSRDLPYFGALNQSPFWYIAVAEAQPLDPDQTMDVNLRRFHERTRTLPHRTGQ